MIEFKNMSVGFSAHKEILVELNGSLKRGELVALVGVNGIGKSCFLKTLTLLHSPLAGELRIAGKTHIEISPLTLAKTLAVVLTDKIQGDFLRVEELISLGRSPYTNSWGSLTTEDDKKIAEVITLLKINDISDGFFSDLSDGQKQKVLLARALVQEPHYLILDEPTTYLDIPSKNELMKVLKLVSKEKGVGVLFSTHDLQLAEEVVDQIWLIDSEGILHKNNPEDMRASGLLAKNFYQT